MTLIIILFLVALALIVAEVMFPSFGILGLLAATAFLVAIVKAFQIGKTSGMATVVAALILIPVAMSIGFSLLKYSPVGRKILLSGPKRSEVTRAIADPTLDALVGRTGVTQTELRPSGTVLVDGEPIDAVSDGAFFERDQTVRIIRIEMNQAVVEKTTVPNPS